MISAPLIAALLRLIAALGIFAVRAIADGGAMNDGHDALVGCELVPIDVVAFIRVNRQSDVRILPGFVEFGGLDESFERVSNEHRKKYVQISLHSSLV